MLHGRSAELATLDRLLDDARAGRSGVLVVRGEAGIGKSALLDHLAARAAGPSTADQGFRVLRGTAVESESEIPFAGLHLLLTPVVDRVTALPPPQATALRAALGLAPPDRDDGYLVGLAVLTLLADLAEQGPVLCLVDDAHWLDEGSARALVFAARRLQAEGVAVVFAARDLHAPPFPAPGLPELRLTGLAPAAVAALLAEHAADLPRHVRAQIAAEARGNPLALLELPAAQREGHLTAAHAHHVAALPAHSRVQQTFADRIAALPERTRTLLLVAAADDTGDPGAVVKAAELLGASIADLEPAERRQLLRSDGGRLAFRHPLIRAAAYRGAPLARRLAVHRALAGVLEDAHRAAWHLAAATTEPDEAVAAALARTAEDARGRGGFTAVATAYQRAAELSPDPLDRGRRLVAAAGAAGVAGQFDRAAVLAEQAWDVLRDPVEVARAARIQARVASERGFPAEAAATLVRAASCAAHAEPELAGEMLFNAAQNAWAGRDLAAVREIADRVGDLPGAADTRAVARAALGLEGGDVPGGLAALRELLRSPYAEGAGDAVRAWWHLVLGDDRAASGVAVEMERRARAQGALAVLPRALAYLARCRLHLGRHREARATAEEGLRIADDIGQGFSVGFLTSVLAELAAVEGDERRCAELVARQPVEPPGSVRAACALALLDLGLGRHDAVLERLADAAAGTHRLYAISSLPDLVEAAVRTGDRAAAEDPAAWYAEWAEHTGRPWARAVAARCRALLTDDERWFTRAAELHRGSDHRPFERARTDLLHGEWLRRARRRADARTPLRAALEVFERLGATPWANRARTELRATGESRAVPGPDPLSALTPQELQVVRLAAEGLSNRDIGAQLFLSPRTVGHHLYKAYPKLGVASRAELTRLDLTG
ncbi:AAA family ATPase [Saccharothrix syringae]|uniref:Helix-turn-helix transcriptional regulator n=1 Tax=Saccharothrix syringae TaxID=103733 RepID=A0A5Q0GSS9_SACSY|nr:helix-turn-helix transcriptional regulator [Saccharothrix syringae]QFZ17038.1 helix-turn-helix transcriptional regulator [Saccharothrix syringae]